MRTIFTVDGLCGSGKTHAALRYAMQRAAQGIKYLIVQPTMALINETITDCSDIDSTVRVRAIHGGTSDEVVADIVRHTKTTEAGGELLFITHSAFMLLPYFDRRRDWHIIWDEVPQADFCDELDVPHSHKLITDFIALDRDAPNLADNRYATVKATDPDQIEAMARNIDRDQVWSVFQQFATKLASPYWASYVLHGQYENLITQAEGPRKLLAFAYLKPSLFHGFESVTLMGACFQQSTLFHLWTKMNVNFRSHHAIEGKLRYRQHQNGHLLTIRYAAEEPWSKTFRDKALTDDPTRTVFDQVLDHIRSSVADTEFVWMGNTDVPDDIFGGRGFRLPNSPHGLNPFQHIHNAVIISALNPRPAHFAFLDALGLDSTAVRQAGYWQSVYQAAMRISLRNPDDHAPKTVTVMDRATAEWLATLFPGAKVEAIGLTGLPTKGKPGRPRKHVSTTERIREHRHKLKNELHAALDLLNGTDPADGQAATLAPELRQKMSELGFGRDPKLSVSEKVDLNALGGTVFTSIFDAEACEVMPREDADQFIENLKGFHAHAVPSKEQNRLVSPAIFDPTMAADTSRGLANIRATWGIWLDNDGGDLTPDEFVRLFPALRIAIFNSYSSTRQNPRWRVFIPTTIAMPAEVYRLIVEQIMRTLNKGGYWSDQQIAKNQRIKSPKRHGFDMSKLVPSSLFYLPSQAADPKGSFFHDYAGPQRAPLDPYAWAGYAANHARPALVPVPTGPAPDRTPDARQAQFDSIIATWRREGGKPGVGNREFFKLGSALAKAGMDNAEVEATLRAEASYARTPADRRRQVKSVIDTIRRRRRA
jgi:hypothetical protein